MAELEWPTRTTAEANKAFLVGKPINDTEVKLLIAFYTRLTDDLAVLGDHFHLSWKECFNRLQTLQSFEQSRKEKF